MERKSRQQMDQRQWRLLKTLVRVKKKGKKLHSSWCGLQEVLISKLSKSLFLQPGNRKATISQLYLLLMCSVGKVHHKKPPRPLPNITSESPASDIVDGKKMFEQLYRTMDLISESRSN